MRNKRLFAVLAIATALSALPAHAVLSAASIPAAFDKFLKLPALANPAFVLIDGISGEVVFEKNSFSQRKPASVMKIFAAASALTYLEPEKSFTTQIWLGSQPKTLVIQGTLDPWISLSHSVARKMDRASLPYLAFNALSAIKRSNGGSLKNITVEYAGLYSQDVANLKAFWAKRGFKPAIKSVTSSKALRDSNEFIVGDESPELSKILDFSLKWSDNLLSQRLARLSSQAAGYSLSDIGVQLTFEQLLNSFEIDSTKLIAVDASGLSKENRITASMLGKLLFKLRNDPKYELFYKSLPVAGVSGTLRYRFLTTAPSAVGLVRAKTGTLNGTVTLAGYVESTDREYIFVTLADEIPRGTRASDKARAAIDRLLGRIAAPNIPAVISEATATP